MRFEGLEDHGSNLRPFGLDQYVDLSILLEQADELALEFETAPGFPDRRQGGPLIPVGLGVVEDIDSPGLEVVNLVQERIGPGHLSHLLGPEEGPWQMVLLVPLERRRACPESTRYVPQRFAIEDHFIDIVPVRMGANGTLPGQGQSSSPIPWGGAGSPSPPSLEVSGPSECGLSVPLMFTPGPGVAISLGPDFGSSGPGGW